MILIIITVPLLFSLPNEHLDYANLEISEDEIKSLFYIKIKLRLKKSKVHVD